MKNYQIYSHSPSHKHNKLILEQAELEFSNFFVKIVAVFVRNLKRMLFHANSQDLSMKKREENKESQIKIYNSSKIVQSKDLFFIVQLLDKNYRMKILLQMFYQDQKRKLKQRKKTLQIITLKSTKKIADNDFNQIFTQIIIYIFILKSQFSIFKIFNLFSLTLLSKFQNIIKLLIINHEMETNGVNYYKGVLLCSRPNQSPSIPKEKPFCPRVTPYDQIGLVPTKKFDQHQVKKRVLPVLNNHKKWLEGFKKKIVEKKHNEQEEKNKQIEKLEKIKQQGIKRRETFKKPSQIQNNQSTNFSLPNKQEVTPKQNKPQGEVFQQKKRLGKKGEKPGWAKSNQQREAEQQKQVDQLLDFFDNTEVKDYLDDQEVNKMLKDLKERIEQMRNDPKQGDWKKKQVDRIRQAKIQNQNNDNDKKDDILSRISKNSEAKSMTSQKTAERVEELQKKKAQNQWEKNTLTDKKSFAASVDMQIAKNVADEVLRNYPALKHHSNQSIRKLLQKQAHEQIKA